MDYHTLRTALSDFLVDRDGARTGFTNNITAAVFGVANALNRIADELGRIATHLEAEKREMSEK